MKSIWLLTGWLCVGCAAQGADRPVAVEQSAAPLAVVDGARERLLARIDATGLALGPREEITEATGFDEMSALAQLKQLTGASYESAIAEGTWRAKSGGYEASFDLVSGALLVSGPDTYDAELAAMDDGLFEERARALLGGFVGDVPRELTVKHLGATTMTVEGKGVGGVERLGTKVFAFRSLGGLPVAGNRLVASFLNDGRLRVLRGLWPTIDVARSRLASRLSADEVVERALDVLVSHEVNPDRDDPIVLESFYELRQDQRGWVAVLRGAALVTSYGIEEASGRRERHEFDL